MIFFRRKKVSSPDVKNIELPPLPDIEEPIKPKESFESPLPQNLQLPLKSEKPSETQESVKEQEVYERKIRDIEVPPFVTEIKAPEPITTQKPLVEEPEKEQEKSKIKGPIFVHADKYKALIEELDEIEKNLKEAKDIIINLNEIKNEKDSAFEKWRVSLEDAQKKLLSIDNILAR